MLVFTHSGNAKASRRGTGNKYGSHAFLYKLIANEERPKAFVKTMQIVRFLTAALLATLISLSSAAQINWWDSSKSNEGVSLSAQFGLNLSHFTHIDRWSDIKAGVNVGIIAEKPILKSLAVKAGVLYTMKGAIGNNDGGFGGRLITTLSPSYLEIPILASYRLQYNDDVRFTFDFGPSVVYKSAILPDSYSIAEPPTFQTWEAKLATLLL